uniref:SCP domain-containing protein n=1 Tax=Mesocestoides corti TaxID=53468 RepID=A0A5K3FCD1_MESCO
MQKLLCVLIFTWYVVANLLSDNDRQAILECHLRLREIVQPNASNMWLMEYSKEVEKLAETFVETCPSEQDEPSFSDVGFVEPVSYYFKPEYNKSFCQIKMPKTGYNCTPAEKGCRFYKQMVWANSTHVGCAAKKCQMNKGFFNTRFVLVCLYKPG